MPGQGTDAAQNSAFLDEFYAECDEHLTEVRRRMESVGSLPPQTAIPRPICESLARHFHALKGIFGLADLADCARLSDTAERYVRVLLRGEAWLCPADRETLTAVVLALEQTVAAHRQKLPLPDLAPIQARATQLMRKHPAPLAQAITDRL